MKHSIITIAGAIGSGKSTTARRVAEELGYAHFSSGDLFRAIAKERGISIEEINREAELENEIDHAVDDRLKQLYDRSELVVDSRLAYHWMPESFKVYLAVDPQLAAERIYYGIKKEGRVSQKADSVAEALSATRERYESEKKRYHDLYGIDVDDHSMFDLQLDTGQHKLDMVIRRIIEGYHAWLKHP